jgi:tripartite-type tricarboxylate transporter receptor subunit TctC
MRAMLAVVAWLFVAGAALAQAYPNRAVKVVVPWPPGQATDIAARIVAEKLQAALGQPFVVENRPGAGGSIGSDVVAKAAPDGYTLLAASSGPISIMPHLQKTPYDPAKDFAPVSLIALVPFVLVANPSFPANDLKGFIANVRANPGKYSFSSSGTAASAYMITSLFNTMAQLDAQHVPYKGTAPAITDIIGGQITYTVETVAATVGHVKAGRLKAFGTSFARRTSAMPDVPTIAEAGGLAGYDIGAWVGYTAPAGAPREAMNRLSAEIQKIVQTPDLKERYLSLGLDTISSTPDEMATFLRQQQERYGSIIKAQGIKAE